MIFWMKRGEKSLALKTVKEQAMHLKANKYLTYCLNLTCFITAISSFNVYAGDRLNEKSRLYAAHHAARIALDALEHKKLPGIVKQSKGRMLSDIKTHKIRSKSRKKILTFIESQASKTLNSDLLMIQKRFNVTFKPGAFKDKKNERIGQYITKNGTEIFNKARDEAEELQLGRMSFDVYPSIKKVMDMDAAGWGDAQAESLKQELVPRMRFSEKHIFDMVERKIKERAEKIYENIRSQVNAQHGAVTNHQVNRNIVTQTQIERGWRESVNASLDKLKAKQPKWQKFYPLLPSVAAKISSKAKRIEQERFREFIQTANIETVSQAELTKLITGNLKAHKKMKKSLEKSASSIDTRAKEEIVSLYVERAPEIQRAAFKQHLKRYLPNVKADIKKRVRAIITPLHKKVRANIAEMQLKQYFRPLADRTWELIGEREVIIKRIKIDQNLDINSVEDSFDKKKPIIGSIKSKNFDRATILQETEKLVLIRTQGLISEASDVWNAQFAIYDSNSGIIKIKGKNIIISKAIQNPGMYSGVVNKLSKLFSWGKDTNDNKEEWSKEEWSRYFTEMIENVWQQHRVTLGWRNGQPEYSKNKYNRLFDYIIEKIKTALTNDVGNAFKAIAKKKAEEERIAEAKRKADADAAEDKRKKNEAERRARENPTPAVDTPAEDEASPVSDPAELPNIDPRKNNEPEQKKIESVVDESTNWLMILVVLVLFAAVIWWLSHHSRKKGEGDPSTGGAKPGLLESFVSILKQIKTPKMRPYLLFAVVTLIYIVSLVYLFNRNPVNTMVIDDLNFQMDEVNSNVEAGIYVYNAGDYVLTVTSKKWPPPKDVQLSIRRRE